jgi:hypothetical protein
VVPFEDEEPFFEDFLVGDEHSSFFPHIPDVFFSPIKPFARYLHRVFPLFQAAPFAWPTFQPCVGRFGFGLSGSPG